MRRVRIVLDTNVLVSALLFSGPPHDVLELVTSGRVECALSVFILEELRDVLQRAKFGYSREQAEAIIEELRASCEVITPLVLSKIIAADPDDDEIVACAVAAGADFIISGDHHLLTLLRFREIRILSPRDFLAHFANETS